MEDLNGNNSRQVSHCSGYCMSLAVFLGVALIVSSLTGCLNRNMHKLDTMNPDQTYFHDGQYILIHEDGYAFDPEGDFFPSTAKFEASLEETVRPRIENFLKEQEERSDGEACRGRLRILIFVHGGLNTYETSFKRIQKLWPTDSEGGLKRSCYFPIFINWNSDLLTSLQDDFFRVRRGRTDIALSVITSPFLLVERIVESIGSLPLSLVHNYLNIKEAAVGGWEEGDPLDCIVGDTLLHLPFQALYIGTIPLLDGFGGGAWQIMKRRAELAVASRLEDPPDDTIAIVRPYISPYVWGVEERPAVFQAEGAVRTFVRRFRSWLTVGEKDGVKFAAWRKGNEVVPVEVTLVGHSAGSLVANRMLAMTDESLGKLPPLPLAHVIHAGPVAPIHEWDDFVVPYLARNSSNGAVKPDFSLFNLNRRDEAQEPTGGWAFFMPRGSLVVWVDLFLQQKNTLGQSTSGWGKNVQEHFRLPNGRGVPGETCGGLPSGPADGPASKPNPLKSQYQLLPIEPPTPLTKQQFKVFKAPRRLAANNVPRVHSDFDEPNFFPELLCHVDEGAFKDPAFCDRPPDWVSAQSP
jgi:hypothetical protein